MLLTETSNNLDIELALESANTREMKDHERVFLILFITAMKGMELVAVD